MPLHTLLHGHASLGFTDIDNSIILIQIVLQHILEGFLMTICCTAGFLQLFIHRLLWSLIAIKNFSPHMNRFAEQDKIKTTWMSRIYVGLFIRLFVCF